MAELKGTRELTNALLKLPAKIEAKALRKAALSGARVVKSAIVALAPIAAAAIVRKGGVVTPPGVLRRAVVVKYAKEKSGIGKASYVVAVRHGTRYQKANRDAFYWLWVEQGHQVIGRSKRLIGQAAAHPFFVPGYRLTADQARQTMKDTLEIEVAKIIKGG